MGASTLFAMQTRDAFLSPFVVASVKIIVYAINFAKLLAIVVPMRARHVDSTASSFSNSSTVKSQAKKQAAIM